MTRWNWLYALAAPLAGMVVQPALARDHWVSLFNGRDLSGWRQISGNATYSVENGEIVGRAHAITDRMNPMKPLPNSFLVTTRDYADFTLELDFKVDRRLNSGVQFRSAFAEQPFSMEWQGKTIRITGENTVYGYQVEIESDPNGKMLSGGVYDERRRLRFLAPNDWPDGPATREFAEQNRRIMAADGWNHFRIEAIGDRIRTWLNGVPRTDFRDAMTASGFIGLQVHNVFGPAADGAEVRFRNIRIMPRPGHAR